MNNQFKIDGRALIPRPETEYMIQAVNEYTQLLISQSDSKNNIILDI
jgi:methylase of polypeptide subunit release factors